MPEGIVKHLEAVQIQHHQSDLPHLPVGNIDGMGEVFHKEAAIGQAGEGIGGFQSLQIHLYRFALIDFLFQFPSCFQQSLVAFQDELHQQGSKAGEQAHQQQAGKGHGRPAAALAFDPLSRRCECQ